MKGLFHLVFLSRSSFVCDRSSFVVRGFSSRSSNNNALHLSYELWNKLEGQIDSMRSRPLYPGSFQILTNFKEPHPLAVQSDLLVLAFMQLLELYVYHLDLKYMKLTIGYNMFIPSSRDLSVTLGEAIPLHDGKSSLIPKRKVYDAIWHLVSSYAELYQEASIRCALIRVYYEYGESVPEVVRSQKSSKELITGI